MREHASTDFIRNAFLFGGKIMLQLDRSTAAKSLGMIGTALSLSADHEYGNAQVLYQLHSMRLKVAMQYMRGSNREPSASGVAEGLRWMFSKEAPPAGCDDSFESKAWVVVLDAIAGLRRCREIEPHDAKSVYRLAQFIFQGNQLYSVPQWAIQRLQALGVEELSIAAAAIEMSRLFETRVPQVVAVWAVEKASSSYDRVLQRTAKFDNLLRKYFEFYVLLLVTTDDLPRVQQLIGHVAASKKRGIVMDWMVDTLVPGVLAVVRNLASERSPLQCLHTLYDASECFKQRKHLPSFAVLLSAMSDYLSVHLGEDVGSNYQAVTAFCSKMWGSQKRMQRQPLMKVDGEGEALQALGDPPDTAGDVGREEA